MLKRLQKAAKFAHENNATIELMPSGLKIRVTRIGGDDALVFGREYTLAWEEFDQANFDIVELMIDDMVATVYAAISKSKRAG